jgi:nucleotide-binding universal stress UspA family protein
MGVSVGGGAVAVDLRQPSDSSIKGGVAMTHPVPKRILCPVDLAPNSFEILEWAKHVAKAFNAHITIVHAGFYDVPAFVKESMIPAYTDEMMLELNRTLQEQVERLADSVLGEEVLWDAVVMNGHPTEVILGWAEEHRTDLVIMGSHGRSGISRFLMGSVSENVIQHVTCPTLIVRNRPSVPTRLERILCPLSTTYLTRECLDLASYLASSVGGELYLLSAVDEITELVDSYRTIANRLPEGMKDRSHVFEIVKKGNAAEQIIRWTRDHKVDLVVFGANHRPFLEFTTLGTTAVRLIRHSPCSVLLVPWRKSEPAKYLSTLDSDEKRHVTAG